VRFLPFLLLLAGCSIPPLSQGDTFFRVGDYPKAIEVWTQALGEGEDAAEVRKRISKARFMALVTRCREEVRTWRTDNAKVLLATLENQNPSHPLVADLRTRVSRKIAAGFFKEGYGLLEAEEPKSAMKAFIRALAWVGDHVGATAGLVDAAAKIRHREELGEKLHFIGLEELRVGNDLRAQASFAHAAAILGEDSRAARFLAELSEDLGREKIRTGKIWIEDGLLGPAWVVLREAARLVPENEEIDGLLESLGRELKARQEIKLADMEVRKGRTLEAESRLDLIAPQVGEDHALDIATLRGRALDRRNHDRYILGRAYELDHQIARAEGLYAEILADTGQEGYEDVVLRWKGLAARLDRARAAFQAALEAEADGDEEAYRRGLSETIQEAGDYEDALERFSTLAEG
jgi:tetratricopeptide (TPR) repeat protein